MTTAHDHDAEFNFSQYVEILMRRRWIVILLAASVICGSAAYAFLWPPVFRASTSVNIEREKTSVVSSAEAALSQDDQYFDTQAKLIISETAMRRVYSDLSLASTKDFSRGLRSLKDAVTVTPVMNTRLCNVNAESTDPQLAMKISSTLAQYFVEQNLNSQLFMSKEVLDALQSRLKTEDQERVNMSLPAVVSNRLVQDIKAQIFTGEAQLADLRMKYTDSHPAVMSLRSRLDSMKKVLNREVGNIVQSLKTELSGQLRANNVRIIDLPQLPDRPVRPRKALALAFGLLGGLSLGIFAALLVEMLDQTVRTHDDIERKLGLPFLGLIPYARPQKGQSIFAATLSSDVSLSSEAFRNLRTMLGLAESGDKDPLLLVTSTVQEEGKSFVAANLAVVLAQLGQKVLFVDGDLRRPRVHTNMRASSERGLSDYLCGNVPSPEALVQATEVPRLDVITCGPRPPNPAELLNTDHLAHFVKWAKGKYDRVIIDCPPVFPISDVLLWGRQINRVVFVARFGRTRVPLMKTACARLRSSGVRIMGGVVNAARLSTMTYAEGRYYEQYYRGYEEDHQHHKKKKHA
jgi:capsular exopolysaccharide synthesis family protein